MGEILFALVAGLLLSILLLIATPHVAPRLVDRVFCPAGARIVTGTHKAYDPVARTDVTTHSTVCVDGAGGPVTQGFYGTIVTPFLTFFVPTSAGLWLLARYVARR